MMKTDKEYLELAYKIASNSEDPNTKTGAIIINRFGEVIASGYNHFHKSLTKALSDPTSPITMERGSDYIHSKYPYVIHAETSCVVNLLRRTNNNAYDLDQRPYIMYMTLAPCDKCAQMILESGVKKIVFAEDKYHDKDYCIAGAILLQAAGIETVYLPL